MIVMVFVAFFCGLRKAAVIINTLEPCQAVQLTAQGSTLQPRREARVSP